MSQNLAIYFQGPVTLKGGWGRMLSRWVVTKETGNGWPEGFGPAAPPPFPSVSHLDSNGGGGGIQVQANSLGGEELTLSARLIPLNPVATQLPTVNLCSLKAVASVFLLLGGWFSGGNSPKQWIVVCMCVCSPHTVIGMAWLAVTPTPLSIVLTVAISVYPADWCILFPDPWRFILG